MGRPSPEYEAFAKSVRPGLALEADPPLVVREKMHAIHPTAHPGDTVVEPVVLGGIRAAWVSAPEQCASPRAFLHVHGGAFVSTGIPHFTLYALRLSEAFRARVLVFDYRWAPEHPFPAALDDTVAVLRTAFDEGLAPGQTALGGDSCGGGLALAALCELRDRGEARPSAYVGLTPWLDAEQRGDAALRPRGVDPFVETRWIRRRFRDYAGPGGDLRDPRLSPIHADLAGLPPLYLGVGTIDTTSDDATRLARRAEAQGVEVTLDVAEGMIHGFHGLVGVFPEAAEGLARAGAFLDLHLGDAGARSV
ncbi:MAG: alpha/beta hydrolase [Planctomycetota bacterium]|jgi:acetyl esterase/lipase|nr:alpha/beta hydrolase [Planctomycetota bacterium]